MKAKLFRKFPQLSTLQEYIWKPLYLFSIFNILSSHLITKPFWKLFSILKCYVWNYPVGCLFLHRKSPCESTQFNLAYMLNQCLKEKKKIFVLIFSILSVDKTCRCTSVAKYALKRVFCRWSNKGLLGSLLCIPLFISKRTLAFIQNSVSLLRVYHNTSKERWHFLRSFLSSDSWIILFQICKNNRFSFCSRLYIIVKKPFRICSRHQKMRK